MDALTRDCGKKAFLILDNLRVHHCKPVKAWLKQNKTKIEVFYLPSYSPQLNPDERLNADLKYALGSSVAMRNKSALWHATDLRRVKFQLTQVSAIRQSPRMTVDQ